MVLRLGTNAAHIRATALCADRTVAARGGLRARRAGRLHARIRRSQPGAAAHREVVAAFLAATAATAAGEISR